MTILHHDPQFQDDQWIGRSVKNVFGMDETAVLPATHWQHFDWLKSIGVDVDDFTMSCDVSRHSLEGFTISFSGCIEMALVQSERRRYLAGDDMPLFINPDGYSPKKEPQFHEQEIKREVCDAKGETVTLMLPRGYWQYLDWLGKQGVSTEEYIVSADRMRKKPEWKRYTLRGVVQNLLWEDEKKRYFSDEPSPLYISPDGY